jgi:hypothetical protein
MSDQLQPSAMLAAPFAWTSGGTDLAMTFASGASPVNVTVASGTYRVLLSPAASDLLAVLNAAIVSALSAAPITETIVFSMTAAGLVTITASAAVTMADLHTSALGAILGFTSGIAGSFTTRTADRMPRHVALLCGQASAPWAPTREMAVEMAAGGTTYGVMGTQETHETDAVFSFIPDEPGITSDALTPWAPVKANLATVGTHTGVWSVRDMLRLAIGQTWTFAHDYQTVRSSSSERFDYVTVHHDTIRAPRITRSIPDVIRYTTWTARLVRVSPYTGVRA